MAGPAHEIVTGPGQVLENIHKLQKSPIGTVLKYYFLIGGRFSDCKFGSVN
jgi:hypothetical protein